MPKKTSAKKKAAKTLLISHDELDIEKRRESSLKLAHLTATLKMAGIIPHPLDEGDDPTEFEPRNSPRRLILAASQFLATCAEVQSVLQEAQILNSKQAAIDERLQELSWTYSDGIIPISEVLKLAGASKLQLTVVVRSNRDGL